MNTTADRRPQNNRLELRREPSGWRHYLDGRPVHCGTVLELKAHAPSGCTWLRVRYEWTCDAADRARLHWADKVFLHFSDYELRWPQD